MNINATILGQTIAFVLFVLFCMKYVWPPIISAIEKRQKEISDNLYAVKQAKKDLKFTQNNIIEKIKKAKIEAQIIIEHANKQSSLIIKKAKIEAENERKKIIIQAQIEINTERKRICEELRKQFTMLVILGVEKIIKRSIDITINNDIIDKLINKL
ncbi:MAG: F0F1 ATP synthase subunit B [Arsenophonus endosymbiont of Ceratovacuna japonica]